MLRDTGLRCAPECAAHGGRLARLPVAHGTLDRMHVVALTRWGAPLETELPTLASWLGVGAYDLRLSAAAGLPLLLKWSSDVAAAAELTERLRARNHGVVHSDTESAGEKVIAREFSFGPAGVLGLDSNGRPLELAYADISGLIRVLSVESAENTIITREAKLNVGMAVMTGGLKVSKTVERTTRNVSEEREQQLLVWKRGLFAPWVFGESSLRYQGLGAKLKPTSIQNFQVLIEELRARAPQALYDQRLLTQKRKVTIASAQGPANARSVKSSNTGENDLAAHLLVLAFEQGQL